MEESSVKLGSRRAAWGIVPPAGTSRLRELPIAFAGISVFYATYICPGLVWARQFPSRNQPSS